MGNTVGLVPTNGWINGLLSCFNWNIIGKGKAPQIEQSEFFSFLCISGQNMWLVGIRARSALGTSRMNEWLHQKDSWHRERASGQKEKDLKSTFGVATRKD